MIGKGKEYHLNGFLRFEGEYINERKWNGIGYDNKGEKKVKIKEGEKILIN